LFWGFKENPDEALRLLEVYHDTYMNVGLLHQTIVDLQKG